MKYDFSTKFEIGQTVWLNVAGSDSYLITNIIFDAGNKVLSYELMNATGYKDIYTALELSSEKLIEV